MTWPRPSIGRKRAKRPSSFPSRKIRKSYRPVAFWRKSKVDEAGGRVSKGSSSRQAVREFPKGREVRSLLRRIVILVLGTTIALSAAAPAADAIVIAKYRVAGVIHIEENGAFTGVGRINVCLGTPDACTTARNGEFRFSGKAGVIIIPGNPCVLSLGDGTMTIDWRQSTPNSTIQFTIQTFAAHTFDFIGRFTAGTFRGANVQVVTKLRGLLVPCTVQRLGFSGQMLVEELPII